MPQEGTSINLEPEPTDMQSDDQTPVDDGTGSPKPPETVEGLKAEMAVLKERYRNSSHEAIRLVDEVKDLKTRLDKTDKQLIKRVESMRIDYPKRGTGETDNAGQSNDQTGGASPTVPLLVSDTNILQT